MPKYQANIYVIAVLKSEIVEADTPEAGLKKIMAALDSEKIDRALWKDQEVYIDLPVKSTGYADEVVDVLLDEITPEGDAQEIGLFEPCDDGVNYKPKEN